MAKKTNNPPPVSSAGNKVTVVNHLGENEKLSNEILNLLADELKGDAGKPLTECHTVNIMEAIIKNQDVEGYMRQYGVCMCSRCRADVSALILTRLPAKYVVTAKDCVPPIMGFYKSKYKIRIFTEIIKACMDVKERPRHDGIQTVSTGNDTHF